MASLLTVGAVRMNFQNSIMAIVLTLAAAAMPVSASGRANKHSAGDDDSQLAFSYLWEYATVSGALYVAEARCATGNEVGLRNRVRDDLEGYILPEKIDAFLHRTFDDHIRRVGGIPNPQPCNKDDIALYQRLSQTFKARAEEGFASSGFIRGEP